MNAPLTFEEAFMPAICFKWIERAKAVDLPKKGKKRDMDAAAYMQGVLTSAVAGGLLPLERHKAIWFLFAVGRGESYIDEMAKRHMAKVLITPRGPG